MTTHAERCRALVAAAEVATLSTLAVLDRASPVPYGSLVTFASDATGRPLLLLSKLAEHTENLRARPEASLLVCEPTTGDPLAAGRVTILGTCALVPDDEKAEARATFLARQPSAATYVDFADFAFYRLEPRALCYVGGFGRMSWVDAEDYRR